MPYKVSISIFIFDKSAFNGENYIIIPFSWVSQNVINSFSNYLLKKQKFVSVFQILEIIITFHFVELIT